MKLKDLTEMEMPQYSYEDAIEKAQEAAQKRMNDVLVLQRIGKEDADAYEVYMEDAYLQWSFALRDLYQMVARANSRGEVHEYT